MGSWRLPSPRAAYLHRSDTDENDARIRPGQWVRLYFGVTGEGSPVVLIHGCMLDCRR
jgi:hypothetical protein